MEEKMITKDLEKELVNQLISIAREHGLTISNIKFLTEKACVYLEKNATL